MERQKIEPAKITKPMQLLAAWLVGLIVVNGSFLGTAITIDTPVWLKATLVIASIINVPIFLLCIFLLQTKFRPEMQEDSYYAKYLEANTGKLIYDFKKDSSLVDLREDLTLTSNKNLALLSSVEDGLKELSTQVSIFAKKAQGENAGEKKHLENLEETIRKSSHAIALAKQNVLPNDIGVAINDLLPEYEMIRNDLAQANIKIHSTFGSSSEVPEVPRQKVISFGRNTNIKKLRTIVSISLKYGFDLIDYSGKEWDKNRIYIGSYIYRSPDAPAPVKIDDDILDVLNKPTSKLTDLINIILSKGY